MKIIERPIGLQGPCEAVEQICKNARKYTMCGLKPDHFILKLDSELRKEEFVKYMAQMYRSHNVLKFYSGPDDYVLLHFEGTLQNLRKNFGILDSEAVYTNYYEHIIGMSVSHISEHLGETLETEFVKRLKVASEHACIVLFVKEKTSANEEKLLNTVCGAIDNIKVFSTEPYTKDDICNLITRKVKDCGINIRNPGSFYKVVECMITSRNITNEKAAIAAAHSLVDCADFTGLKPFIDDECLKHLSTNGNTM